MLHIDSAYLDLIALGMHYKQNNTAEEFVKISKYLKDTYNLTEKG